MRRAAPALALLVAACHEGTVAARQHVAGGDPARGERALVRYGCGSCHLIPGVAAAQGLTGPPLTYWADRQYVAGRVRNEPGALVRWIRDPKAIDPETAMPDLGVTDADARDMAAYLYTLAAGRLGPRHPMPEGSLPGH